MIEEDLLKEYCIKDVLLTKKLNNELCREGERILFMLQRDGLEKTTIWAKQTMAIYRTAVLDENHHASLPTYKQSFIESYLALKRFINNYGN